MTISDMLQKINEFDEFAWQTEGEATDIACALLELQDDLHAMGETQLVDNIEAILDDHYTLQNKLNEVVIKAQAVGVFSRSRVRAIEAELEKQVKQVVDAKQGLIDLVADWDAEDIETAFMVLMNLKAADPDLRRRVLMELAKAD